MADIPNETKSAQEAELSIGSRVAAPVMKFNKIMKKKKVERGRKKGKKELETSLGVWNQKSRSLEGNLKHAKLKLVSVV